MLKLTLLLLTLNHSPCSAEAPKDTKTSPAAEADNEVVDRRTCKKEKDERLLEVLPKEKGCTLVYTKGGKSETKANSVRGVQICQDALKKIQSRLEAAGYSCE